MGGGGHHVISTRQWPRRVEERFQLEDNECLFLSIHWRHAKDKDFSWMTMVVLRKHNKELDLVLVQYYFQGDKHCISPKKHPGSQWPFIPTASNTRNSLVEKVKKGSGTHNHLWSSVSRSRWYDGCRGCCAHSKKYQSDKEREDNVVKKVQWWRSIFFSETKEKVQSCLRGLQWTPAPRIGYVDDWQMVEIVQNCCKADLASVLSIVTTFNVGKFYVTSTT